jgi:SAM-dependent methyltransferase
MKTPKYLEIVAHYENCLAEYGDSHLGVDWPKQEHVDLRYQVMMDVIKKKDSSRVSLLDFGCGASHLYEYIQKNHLDYIEYAGLDISEKFLALCKQKYPSVQYYCMDILADWNSLPAFDYVVLNGVFTEKRSLSYSEMLAYFFQVLRRVYSKTSVGLAFNVMSSHVDWERDDLFHLPIDTLAAFLTEELSRDFVVRNDYGLYEYTTYVYRRH